MGSTVPAIFKPLRSVESDDEIDGQQPGVAGFANSPTTDEVLQHWQHWEQAHDQLTIAWNRVDQAPLISWFNAECSSGQWEYEEQSLRLDGQRFQFDSTRPYVMPHLGASNVAGPVSLHLPERGNTRFLSQLYSRFRPPPCL